MAKSTFVMSDFSTTVSACNTLYEDSFKINSDQNENVYTYKSYRKCTLR